MVDVLDLTVVEVMVFSTEAWLAALKVDLMGNLPADVIAYLKDFEKDNQTVA
jgi:hypothetical protein